MARPADPALDPIYQAGWDDAVAALSLMPHYVRAPPAFNVFERLSVKSGPRPELNSTITLWTRLLSLYYLADLHTGMDPAIAADRDARRMEHFAKAFTELGL